MNERIRELAMQADLYARSDNSSMLFENYQKRYTEKFAELIVKECIDIVSDCSVEHCTRPQIVSEIREHLVIEK